MFYFKKYPISNDFLPFLIQSISCIKSWARTILVLRTRCFIGTWTYTQPKIHYKFVKFYPELKTWAVLKSRSLIDKQWVIWVKQRILQQHPMGAQSDGCQEFPAALRQNFQQSLCIFRAIRTHLPFSRTRALFFRFVFSQSSSNFRIFLTKIAFSDSMHALTPKWSSSERLLVTPPGKH